MPTPSAHRRRWRLKVVLPSVILLCMLVLAGVFFWRIYATAITERDRAADALVVQREQQVASCERGNILREYVYRDNVARRARIIAGLADEATPNKAQLRAELAYRGGVQEDLRPIDCSAIR